MLAAEAALLSLAKGDDSLQVITAASKCLADHAELQNLKQEDAPAETIADPSRNTGAVIPVSESSLKVETQPLPAEKTEKVDADRPARTEPDPVSVFSTNASAEFPLVRLVKSKRLLLLLAALAMAGAVAVFVLRRPAGQKMQGANSPSIPSVAPGAASPAQPNQANAKSSFASNSQNASPSPNAAPTENPPAPAAPKDRKPEPDAKLLLAKGQSYYKAAQYQQAVPLLRRAAEASNGRAAAYMGLILEKGLGGVPKDETQAVSWYRKAANAGDARGMSGLGSMYAHGRGGLPKDDVQAASWFRKAADAGDAHGMNGLGVMYEKGLGGAPKDEVRAASWFRKAIEGGEPLGMSNLGLIVRERRRWVAQR